MERLILPVFAVFGFLASMFFESSSTNSTGKITQTGKAQAEYD